MEKQWIDSVSGNSALPVRRMICAGRTAGHAGALALGHARSQANAERAFFGVGEV